MTTSARVANLGRQLSFDLSLRLSQSRVLPLHYLLHITFVYSRTAHKGIVGHEAGFAVVLAWFLYLEYELLQLRLCRLAGYQTRTCRVRHIYTYRCYISCKAYYFPLFGGECGSRTHSTFSNRRISNPMPYHPAHSPVVLNHIETHSL